MVCSVCGKKLTDPASIEVGCGPACYQKLHGRSLKKSNISKNKVEAQNKQSACYNIPGQMDLEGYLQEIGVE